MDASREQKKRIRNLALIIGAIALMFYLGFIAVGALNS
jgi:hypothetical protein